MKIKITAVILLIFIIVSTGLTIYNNSLQSSLSKSTSNTLEEIMMQQKNTLISKFEGEISVIRSISQMITDLAPDDISYDKLIEVVENTVANSGFSYILLAGKAGNYIGSGGVTGNISDRDYYKRAMNGETNVSETLESQVNGEDVIVFATPIVFEGKVDGVLAGIYNAHDFANLFVPPFEGMGSVNVIDKFGNTVIYISNKEGDELLDHDENFFTVFKDKAEILAHDSYDTIAEKISNGKSGYTLFKLDGDTRIMHYAPIGFNDWYISSIIAEDVISEQKSTILGNAMYLTTGVIAVFAILIGFIIWSNKRSSHKLKRAAYFDELTGLHNRAGFIIDAERILKDNSNKTFCVTVLDIRRFKVINELFGFGTGDNVIRNIAAAISAACTGKVHSYAHLHVDRFIVLQSFDNEDEMNSFKSSFEDKFRKLCGITESYTIEFRYGRYFIEHGETNIHSILQKVNLAHNIAKTEKVNGTCDYNDEFKERVLKETEIENKMYDALEKGMFKVYLQPKYSLDSELVVGAEALVRWEQEDGSIISPATFIPVFEKNGFITKLDMYMLEQVCRLLMDWMDSGKPLVTISVNFSRLHLNNVNFVEQVEEIVNNYAVPKKYIEIELTESTIFNNEDILLNILNNLHEAGFTLSMDDFGTGYSSLGLLKNLPVDVIKIDRGFFDNNRFKSRSKTVIASVMKMAKELKIKTVAEGVETQEHVDLLRDVGCDIVQGYYYAKPKPAIDFSANKIVPFQRQDYQPELNMSYMGNLGAYRDEIGTDVPLAVYRMFQYAVRDALIDVYGEGEMIELFRLAGAMAGRTFAKETLDLTLPFDKFAAHLSESLKKSKIGMLEINSFDAANGKLTLSVYGDLDCSGISNIGKTLCQYDEGFIAGILGLYTGKSYNVIEVACWGTGHNACIFEAKPK